MIGPPLQFPPLLRAGPILLTVLLFPLVPSYQILHGSVYSLRSVLGVHWKDWCWSWNSSTLATSWEELTHCERPWCWEGLGAGGEGDDRGWDGWMASPTWWTWVWVNSVSWWWTGRPGVLQFMGSQRVGQDWATELTDWLIYSFPLVRYSYLLSAGVCRHFCVGRCIPDISMERDSLHFHLLCHLVLSSIFFCKVPMQVLAH